MGSTLTQIAQELKNAIHISHARPEKRSDVKVQLIYAFNSSGKTRLSKEFKELIVPKNDDAENANDELSRDKILYYNAFTEDLFSWDNDLENDSKPKLIIKPNSFTHWILQDQGEDRNIVTNFQRYTNDKLTPNFNAEYLKDEDDSDSIVKAFSEVSFSLERGNNDNLENMKISKGEESNFIWSIFYTLIEQVISVLNVLEEEDRETDQFNNLEYIFIDDPVSSLDENHLIELAVDLAKLIKSSKSGLKFIITTHSPIFYNVLYNALNKNTFKKYILKKDESGEFNLIKQSNDSPFSYHLFIKEELEKAINEGQIYKYHFNFLRNILEKTSTFLGYSDWGDLLTPIEGERDAYVKRILDLNSHSKHSADEMIEIDDNDKRVLRFLVQELNRIYHFKSNNNG